ncbi:MAG TPA: hypothetical protein VMP01_18145 [Pirellulaceae bacterium]|nr:hypothetical protein [Pirellulaceae bacterium]
MALAAAASAEAVTRPVALPRIWKLAVNAGEKGSGLNIDEANDWLSVRSGYTPQGYRMLNTDDFATYDAGFCGVSATAPHFPAISMLAWRVLIADFVVG